MRAARQDTAQWQAEMLSAVPGQWRERVRKLHIKKLAAAMQYIAGSGLITAAVQVANAWLMDTTERMRGLRVPVNLSDDELCDKARQCVLDCFGLAEIVPGVYAQSVAELRDRMSRYCARYSVASPDENVEDAPALRRMTDNAWWLRGLRVAQARALEREAIGLGYVHRYAEMYASDATVERRTQQRRRNAAALENIIAVNQDTGEEFALAELAARSVANPAIRRGELMTRIAGFEAVAKGVGHAAEFVTLTTPSKYHPKKTDAGRVIENPKYGGATPREAQKYLTGIWAKIRACLGRAGIRPYGFRIAEPHHDATPHWHLLLFVSRDQVGRMREIIRRYALAEDGTEPGAQKNRVEFVTIDPQRGSAAGYIAKYVAKNIDGGGYQVQGDLEGGQHDAITPSHRVEAWASTWGIRQFQQVGGAPVGVWRELRRTERNEAHGEAVAAALEAADAGNWGRFTEVMGGATVARKNLPMRVAYTAEGQRWDCAAGAAYDAPPNRYGETAARAVYGVVDCLTGEEHAAKRYRWEIKRAAHVSAARVDFGFDIKAVLSPPWSPVNNCTRTEMVLSADEQKTLKSWDEIQSQSETWKKWSLENEIGNYRGGFESARRNTGVEQGTITR